MKRPPPEVPVDRSTDALAPRFRAKIDALLLAVPDAKISETLRTPERQAFLYGFGREYDDGRGIVTNAPSNLTSWHAFGLAADIIHATLEWDAGEAWFKHMGAMAVSLGLEWGGNWKHPDRPHVQFGGMKDSPSDTARSLYASGGNPAVWAAVHAD